MSKIDKEAALKYHIISVVHELDNGSIAVSIGWDTSGEDDWDDVINIATTMELTAGGVIFGGELQIPFERIIRINIPRALKKGFKWYPVYERDE